MGNVSYRLALPPVLSHIHNLFHVSVLQKYMPDPSHVLEYEPINVREDLSYEEQPVQIIDRKDQVLRSRNISLVKVLWRNHAVQEATWEKEEHKKEKYPHLFSK